MQQTQTEQTISVPPSSLPLQFLNTDINQLLRDNNVSTNNNNFHVHPELFRALLAKSMLVDPMMASLPPQLDHLWHELILESEIYDWICLNCFGRKLHHTQGTVSDPVDVKNRRVDILESTYFSIFKSSSPRNPELWVREEEGDYDGDSTQKHSVDAGAASSSSSLSTTTSSSSSATSSQQQQERRRQREDEEEEEELGDRASFCSSFKWTTHRT